VGDHGAMPEIPIGDWADITMYGANDHAPHALSSVEYLWRHDARKCVIAAKADALFAVVRGYFSLWPG
jgi:hypothetical protein